MKWFGEIGFNIYTETEPGVHEPKLVRKKFFGDVLNPSWREQQGDKINPDTLISNKLSIIYDTFILNNLHKIAYVEFGGAKWTVSSVAVDTDRPRINISLGSLYLEEVEDEDES